MSLQSVCHGRRRIDAVVVVECPFEFRQQFELSDLSDVFLESRWRHALQAVTVLYLFGDLVIFACAVPTSLASFSGEISLVQYVFDEDEIGDGAYYLWLLVFASEFYIGCRHSVVAQVRVSCSCGHSLVLLRLRKLTFALQIRQVPRKVLTDGPATL